MQIMGEACRLFFSFSFSQKIFAIFGGSFSFFSNFLFSLSIFDRRKK